MVSGTTDRLFISIIRQMGARLTSIGGMTGVIAVIFDAVHRSCFRKPHRRGFSGLILITWTTTKCGTAAVTRHTSATYMGRRDSQHITDRTTVAMADTVRAMGMVIRRQDLTVPRWSIR